MHILAFYFSREDAARAAAADLQDGTGVSPSVIETAPLVLDRVEGTILAVTVEAERESTIVELAVRHGGRLVASVSEERTHSH